ncbi:MAG: endonuclease III [Prevotellaceae bacterium]|nr:endonuclease III [Prevotellaceae bacterium]
MLTKKQRYDHIIQWFLENKPVAESELHYRNPFELLVAVILSAQCTDKRVNMITPPLFKACPTPEAMSKAGVDKVFEIIHSVSYPNSKARHLVAMAQKLQTDFAGEVPDDTDALQTLPGVGRKTANVIASVIFHQPKMAVDTHVFRVAERLGLTTNAKTPLQTENELVRHIPTEHIATAHHWLILHGRYVCKARAPLCEQCGLKPFCRYFARQVPVSKEQNTP